MKEYYLDRFRWIFNYTGKGFWYCLGKTLCLIVGVPIYAVSFVLEMTFTLVNMIFSWIPVLNVVVMTLCKALMWLFGWTFYLCILTDLKAYREAHAENEDTSDEEISVADEDDSEKSQEAESACSDGDDAEN